MSSLLLALVKTPLGRVSYTLMVGGLVAIQLIFRMVLNPFRFWHKKDRSQIAIKLNNPELGTHRYLMVNGIKIHAVTTGEEKQPLLLFVHGFPEFWYSFRHQIKEFAAKGYFCVAIDMRGYGDSDKPSGIGEYHIKKLAADLAGVIEQLGYQQAEAVVGHDWGSMVCYAFAAYYPGSLRRLMILNGPHPIAFRKALYTYPQILKSAYTFFFQLPFLPELAFGCMDYGVLKQVFCSPKTGVINKDAFSDEELEIYKYNMSKPGAVTGGLNYYRCVRYFEDEFLPQIKAPTMVLWGTEDGFLASNVNKELGKHVENLDFREVPNCSHWIQCEKPQEVNRALEEFLQKK